MENPRFKVGDTIYAFGIGIKQWNNRIGKIVNYNKQNDSWIIYFDKDENACLIFEKEMRVITPLEKALL